MKWSNLRHALFLIYIFVIIGLFPSNNGLPENVITFREADAAVVFALFNGEEVVAIRFEFKTTNADGVLIHGNGGRESNFIQIKIENGNTLQFRYNVGTGVHSLQYSHDRTLTDDTWHTLHVEVNLKQTLLRLDNHTDVTRNETGGDVTHLQRLTVGSAEDYSDGFVGCIGDLMVNSALVDMQGAVHDGRFTYGVHEGCVKTNSCSSNPCFNGGQCQEGYSHYTCDCTATPYGGLLCSKEVGVKLQNGAYIQYSDVQDLLTTSFHVYNISFGFITKKKQGILLQIRNDGSVGYLSVEMNNNGGIKYFVDYEFVRHEVNTLVTEVVFSDGQPHEVVLRREKNGRQIYIQVDNYEPTVVDLDEYLVSQSIPDNPKYMFIGNNETGRTSKAFEGCIYRMQIGGFYSLKTAFRDPSSTNIKFVREEDIEVSTCGFEEVIPEQEPKELRPYNPNCDWQTLKGLGLGQGGHMSGQNSSSVLFTISQSNDTLDSNMKRKLSITCSVNETEALLLYYITIRSETSYGSGVFKCLATLEANSTNTSNLNDDIASEMGFATSGTLDTSAPSQPFLMLEKDLESVKSSDVGHYVCEAAFKYSTKDALIVSRKLTTFTNDMLVNLVTFTQPDGILEFATFEGEELIEVQLAFKTTATEGVLVHLSGDTGNDYVQIRLAHGNTIEVLFIDGDGNEVCLLSHRGTESLNNDQWHVIRAKIYETLAWVRVDSSDEVPNASHGISEGTKLIIGTVTVGSARDYSSGYVGCMKDLKINGVLVDMRETTRDGLVGYGVQEGCGKTRKCSSNPCFNGGKCLEGYSHYTCDCSATPFGGSFCSKEVGVNMQASFMIRFDHVQNLLTWRYFQNFSFGLITKERKGILLQWRNKMNTQFVSTEINDNEGVKYIIGVGFEPLELNFGSLMADGRPHEYKMWRENNGSMVFMETDNLIEGTVYSGRLERLEGFIDDPKYLFIGNNDTTNLRTGFEGCIYRMQIDDFYPLKTAFKDPRPDFVNFVPEDMIREDSCGLEEIMPEPEPIKLRPFKPKCGNDTEVEHQLEKQAGNSEEEQHGLTLTFSRNNITLGSGANASVTITCHLNETDAKLIYYLLLRRETAPGSNVFECLAVVEAGEAQRAVLYDNSTKDHGYHVRGSVDMANPSATYLTVEMTVQKLRCDDDRRFMCEAAHRYSTISPFKILRTAKRLKFSTDNGSCADMGKSEKNPENGGAEEKSRTGLIVGVIFGALAVIIIVVVPACYYRTLRRKMDVYNPET